MEVKEDFMIPDSQNNKIVYITEVIGIKIEEIATILSIEGNKTYVKDDYGNYNTFNNQTGYCYTDNTTFGAKKYLKLNK